MKDGVAVINVISHKKGATLTGDCFKGVLDSGATATTAGNAIFSSTTLTEFGSEACMAV